MKPKDRIKEMLLKIEGEYDSGGEPHFFIVQKDGYLLALEDVRELLQGMCISPNKDYEKAWNTVTTELMKELEVGE